LDVQFAEVDSAEVVADALILPFFDGIGWGPTVASADAKLGGLLSELRTNGEASSDFASSYLIPSMGHLPARRVLLLGLGEPQSLDGYRLRNAMELGARRLRLHTARVAVALEPAVIAALGGDEATALRAMVEGVFLANYHSDDASRPSAKVPNVETVVVLAAPGDVPQRETNGRRAVVLAGATNRTRAWQWRPGNLLTPSMMAEMASSCLPT
jgi:leucyl aminopeptidase